MLKVSVIIPTYNNGKYICEAIDSIFAQTYSDYEIIVIDDGSTDNTKEIIERFSGRLRYIYKKNGGISSARNAGIHASKGKYLAFLDADDVWLPEILEKQIKVLEKNTKVGLVYTAKYMMDETGRLTGDVRPHYPARNTNELFKGRIICMSVLAKKDTIIKAGMFDEEMPNLEDLDLWLRVAKSSEIKFIDQPLIKYRLHSNNASRKYEEKAYCSVELCKKILNDEEIEIPKRYKKATLARAYYRLAKIQHEKAKFTTALHSLLFAFKSDMLLPLRFIKNNDGLLLKLKKIINPFGALFVYTFKALFYQNTRITDNNAVEKFKELINKDINSEIMDLIENKIQKEGKNDR